MRFWRMVSLTKEGELKFTLLGEARRGVDADSHLNDTTQKLMKKAQCSWKYVQQMLVNCSS